jgi:hypothetical protein
MMAGSDDPYYEPWAEGAHHIMYGRVSDDRRAVLENS